LEIPLVISCAEQLQQLTAVIENATAETKGAQFALADELVQQLRADIKPLRGVTSGNQLRERIFFG